MSGACIPRKRIHRSLSRLWPGRDVLPVIFFLAAGACGGTFQDSLFRIYSSTSNLVNQDSLLLSVRQWVLTSSAAITRPNAENSRTPDVVGFGAGRFVFTWSDSVRPVHAFDTIYKREIRVTSGGFDTTQPRAVVNIAARPPLKYFHLARGGSGGDLVSSICKGSSNDSVLLVNDLSTIGYSLKSGAGNVTRSSMCYWKGDSFLVTCQYADDKIYLKRVCSGVSLSQAARTDTLAVSTNFSSPSFYVSNSSIAADNAGNVIGLWAVGTGGAGYPKSLRCRVYSSSLAPGDSADFINPIDSASMSNFYDDAPVTAYATGAFGMVTWSPSGILFRSVRIGSPLVVDTVRIEPGPNVRYPSIASNGIYITIVWIKDTLGSSQVKVAGVRDTISTGYIPFSSGQKQLRFTGTWKATSKNPGVPPSAFALNCAMDSLGSIAATWPLDSFVNARLWANRGVRNDSGDWVSQSTRFMDNSGDSVYLLPGRFTIGEEMFDTANSDSVRVYVHAGLDSADESAWRPWTLATDSAALAANTMGSLRFFKYKIVVYRGKDTLGTPVVKKCRFRWNAKPAFQPLDSVLVNGKKAQGMAFGGVDTVMSRSDTLSAFFTLHDADGTDTLYSRVTGYASIVDSLDTLFSLAGRSTSIKCLPVAKSDTTVNLVFSAADKKGWAAAIQGFSIHTRNSKPQLHVYALIDTNHTGVTDTVEVTATKSFTVLQSDSILFLYVCRDTNDFSPQYKAYAVLNRVKVDSTLQAANRNYKFRDSVGRKVVDTLVFSFADPETTVTRTVYFHLRNSVPQLHAYALLDTNHTGKPDTVEILSTKNFNMQQNDSTVFLYKGNDTNDFQPQFRIYCMKDGVKVDSAQQGTNRNYTFKGAAGRAAGDTILFSFTDPETTVTRSAFFRVNHFPVLSSLSMGSRTIHTGDTVSVGTGATVSFNVNAKDTDVTFWDNLSYRYTRKTKDSVTTAASFSFVAARSDSSLLVRVTDSFGKTDSLRFFMISPWLATDTAANKQYQNAKNVLHDSISIIIGSNVKDSVAIPLVNTGDDTLKLTSLRFKGATSGWIMVRVPGQKGSGLFDSLVSGKIDTVPIAAGSTRTIMVYLNPSQLTGDGIMRDTIIFATNDFSHPFDTIPVSLEYNDLPKVASISIDFTPGKPWWLGKKAAAATTVYKFPPHAKISIHFTEPMDTASAALAGVISAFSVFDKRVSANPPPIAFDRTWSGNDGVLSLSPRYTAPSPYFNGFQPPPKFFIPGDSISLTVTSAITDQAKTPHGPNGLDVHKTAVRAVADTTFRFRIDSITYTIDSVYPKDKDTGISVSTPVTLVFSGPPLPSTVDTSKTNNKCLIVRSKYFSNAPVVFSSIAVTGGTVTFKLAKQFFYGDTVTCYYRARWATDSLGYPVVLDNSGIPVQMFDTLSTANDKQWSFIIKDMAHTGVSPHAGDTGVAPATAITVNFADSIPAASIDTSKTGNKQLLVRTAFGKGAQIAFDSVRSRGTSVVFYPARRFFYGDTVFCSYQGLMTKDSLRYSIDLSGKQVLSTNDKTSWSFLIKSIRVVSASPDSASRASIHPSCVLRFSGPVYPGTFDTDTTAKNRSFSITSSFLSDSALSFKSIVFSSDSTQITIKPRAVFFSSDSIHCFFRGFSKTFMYDSAINLPSDSSGIMARHDWYFYTENTGFYTYPNPYKPGSDPRHCRNAATDPCGIWFTNLHLLKKDVNDVVIKIFGMNANPIYNTQTAGISIHFSVSDPSLKPQWKWDTRNQHGELVSSGLYFYAITDTKGSVLIKGKLMIVR
jgi:hypothetical protein